jgi:hypothetical protein
MPMSKLKRAVAAGLPILLLATVPAAHAQVSLLPSDIQQKAVRH